MVEYKFSNPNQAQRRQLLLDFPKVRLTASAFFSPVLSPATEDILDFIEKQEVFYSKSIHQENKPVDIASKEQMVEIF